MPIMVRLNTQQKDELCELILGELGYLGEDISVHDIPPLLQDFGVTREQLIQYLRSIVARMNDLAKKSLTEDTGETAEFYRDKARAAQKLIVQVGGSP